LKPDQSPIDRVRVLLSFHAFRRLNKEEFAASCVFDGKAPEIFADSGAFSAWTQGAVISVDDYAEWLHRWKSVLGVFCNLDVVDDPVATEINQRALESNGLLPLPVWHIRSDRKHFEALCEEYRYIAIGGMVGTQWKRLMPKLTWAVRHARSTGTVLHALGLTSRGPLGTLPFYSVDSSSWGGGYRYGQVPVWDSTTKTLVNIQLGDVKEWKAKANAVKQLGYSPVRFANREATRGEIAGMSALSFVLYEQHLRRTLGIVPLPPGDKPEVNSGQTGLRMYLADANHERLRKGSDGLRMYLADNAVVNLRDDVDGLRLYLADTTGADITHISNHLNKLRESA
jgi:hypothetical protein